MKNLFYIFFFISFLGFSQQKSFSENLFTEYETYKESSLTQRRFKHSDIQLFNTLVKSMFVPFS